MFTFLIIEHNQYIVQKQTLFTCNIIAEYIYTMMRNTNDCFALCKCEEIK